MCLEAGTAEVVSEAVVYRTVREIIFQWKIMASKGVSTLLYHLPYLVVAFALPADELTIGDRINCHGVLEESVEQEATSSRTPSVETERVFIEVVVHMLLAHSPLVGSK